MCHLICSAVIRLKPASGLGYSKSSSTEEYSGGGGKNASQIALLFASFNAMVVSEPSACFTFNMGIRIFPPSPVALDMYLLAVHMSFTSASSSQSCQCSSLAFFIALSYLL